MNIPFCLCKYSFFQGKVIFYLVSVGHDAATTTGSLMELINYFSDANEAVLTTSFVINKTDRITRVYHHLEDGM